MAIRHQVDATNRQSNKHASIHVEPQNNQSPAQRMVNLRIDGNVALHDGVLLLTMPLADAVVLGRILHGLPKK
jgi:outer membrane usher protein FimD/PapC